MPRLPGTEQPVCMAITESASSYGIQTIANLLCFFSVLCFYHNNTNMATERLSSILSHLSPTKTGISAM